MILEIIVTFKIYRCKSLPIAVNIKTLYTFLLFSNQLKKKQNVQRFPFLKKKKCNLSQACVSKLQCLRLLQYKKYFRKRYLT